MIFASQEFIFLFAPVVIIVYWLLPLRYRLFWLTAASYFFYGWWDWRFCFLMLASTLVDYLVGFRLARQESKAARRGWLLVSIAANIGLLAYFKYAGFMAETVNAVMSYLHTGGPFPVPQIVLPIGISFYTFQSMSYTMDIYRNNTKPTRSFILFAAFVSMFPQLIAGPIVRYNQIEQQLKNLPLRLTTDNLNLGLLFFFAGLIKKTLIADRIAYFSDQLWADYSHLNFSGAWCATLGFGLQLYFDFAGYSLMALGLGYLLGLKLPQNFNSPYRATDISDFWRRWHISLSAWLRDYLFVFLGGLKPRMRWFALAGTMLLGGLWHGAAWTFVIWGMLHGLMLLVHHSLRFFHLKWRGGRAGRLGTLLLVMLGWVVFKAPSLEVAGKMYVSLFDIRQPGQPANSPVLFYALLVVALAWAVFAPNLYTWVHVNKRRPSAMTLVALGCLAALAVLFLSDTSPFLYYQF